MAFSFCVLLGFAVIALSKTNEQTLHCKYGTVFKNESIHIAFVAKAVVNPCNVTRRVCGRINGYRETFTINAGTLLPPDTTFLSVKDDNNTVAKILINNQPLPTGVQSIGRLHVTTNTVQNDASFTVPFLIAEIDPDIAYNNYSKETHVLLNGPFRNQQVHIVFAANIDGTGDQFKLTISAGNPTIKGFCLAPVFLASAMVLAGM